MEPLIPDTSTGTRMAGLERFLERYLGPRRPEFGAPEDELRSIPMPAPLQRFFRFAGRWPGQPSWAPYPNRFCVQDTLAGFVAKEYAPVLRLMDNHLAFVWENQGVWVAATEPTGADPPVWVSEDWDRDPSRTWRQLEKPLSHFLVSFVLQEVMFGSELVAVTAGALERFEAACLPVEPVWFKGEYAWDIDRPSYFLVADRFLVRQAPDEASGDDWYACQNSTGGALLTSLGLPTQMA